MLPELISSTISGAAMWQAVKEKMRHLAQKVRNALLALLDGIAMESIINWLGFADEYGKYLDWTDDYWHMPRFPYDAEEDY